MKTLFCNHKSWLKLAFIICLLSSNITWAVISPTDTFPVPNGQYDSSWGTGFGSVGIEILSITMIASPGANSVELPDYATDFPVESFFDVFVELDMGGGSGGIFFIDSFFDVFTELSVDSTTAAGVFDTEIVSMSLYGGPSGVLIREDPYHPSLGSHIIEELPRGNFNIDSFFDVFVELSVDGGDNWLPATNAIRMNLVTPEPTSMALLGLGSLVLLRKRRV